MHYDENMYLCDRTRLKKMFNSMNIKIKDLFFSLFIYTLLNSYYSPEQIESFVFKII